MSNATSLPRYFFSARPILIDLAFLVFAGTIVHVLAAGDFNVLIANLSLDDTPAVYARFLTNGELYKEDQAYEFATSTGAVSLPVRIGYLGLKYDLFSTDVLLHAYLFLQTVLLMPAVYLYAAAAGVGRWQRLLAVAVMMGLGQFSWWDLGYFPATPSSFYFPYGAALALPFLIFAATLFLHAKTAWAVPLLVLAGWIHPTTALYTAGMTGLAVLIGFKETGLQTVCKEAALLLVAIGLIVLPALTTGSSVEQVSNETFIQAARLNVHMFPWSNPRWYRLSLPNSAQYFLMLFLALRYFQELTPRGRRIVLGGVIGVVILSCAHVLGGTAGIPMLVKLTPFRSSRLLFYLAWPLVALFIYRGCLAEAGLRRASILIVGFTVIHFDAGAAWGPLLALVCYELGDGRLGPWRFFDDEKKRSDMIRAGNLVLIFWVALCLVMFVAKTPESDAPGIHWRQLVKAVYGVKGGFEVTPTYLGLITLSFVVAAIGEWHRRSGKSAERAASLNAMLHPLPVVFLLIAGLVSTVEGARTMGEKTQEREAVDLYNAQLWARDHTDKSSMFLVYRISWRNLSERKAFNARYLHHFVYNASRKTIEENRKLLEFYGLDFNDEAFTSWSKFMSAERSAYYALTEGEILELAKWCGADYIVRTIEEPPLPGFPIAWSSPTLTIYKIELKEHYPDGGGSIVSGSPEDA